MEALQDSSSAQAPIQPLARWDYFTLVAFCFVLFGSALVCGGLLTGHESVLPENTREMLANHDWLVPRLGGEPWLERPPLPSWIMAGVDCVMGQSDSDRIARLSPVLMAICVVVMVSWMAGRWYGRGVGMLGGMILASMWEFFIFASDPEADMFLCAIVTAALALFAWIETMQAPRQDSEAVGVFGRRTWPVVAFFVFLGLTNTAKGLIFGTLMVVVPVWGFLVWNWDFRRARRYLWFWGALIFLGISLAWPLGMYLRHREIMDLWKHHYLGRLSGGYIGEPPWYYLVHLPVSILPWTVAALLGLWLTRSEIKDRYGPARFIWSWALLTPAFFSIPDGKHHHYMLHCLAPWAILSALGAVRLWQWIVASPAWLRRPILSVVCFGLPIDVALFIFRHRIPGPAWVVFGLMIAAPAFAYAASWALTRTNGRLAVGTLFLSLTCFYWFAWAYQTRCLDRYGDDKVFLEQASKMVGKDTPLLVAYDERAELETFWVLFYSRPGSILLTKPADLEKYRKEQHDVYVLARAYDGPKYSQYGPTEIALQSKHSRFEATPAERRTLFHVRFDLARLMAIRAASPVRRFSQ
jgi:4-amino-4-deoxy-L-arabinose transferase-like glycosyltransferase